MSKGLMEPIDRRNLVVYTGQKGYEMIHEALEDTADIMMAEETLKYIKNFGVVTDEEHKNLDKMIHASREDRYVARLAMEQMVDTVDEELIPIERKL